LAFLLGLVTFATAARAQEPSELRELALAIDAHDASTTRSLAEGLAARSPTRLRDTLECFELAFAQASLAELAPESEPEASAADVAATDTTDAAFGAATDAATETSDASARLGRVTRRITTLAAEVDAWLGVVDACFDGAPLALTRFGDLGALHVRLRYAQPELRHAARLAADAAERDATDTTRTLEEEAERLTAALELSSGARDPWPFVEAAWTALDPPAAVSREWPARSNAPSIGSLVLFLASGAVAVFGSLPTLASGRRVFPGIAGAYGLSLSALAASLAGAGWQVRSRAFSIAGAIVATLTGAAGILSITLLPEKRGRFFGGGLTIGAGLGALWTIGAFAHLRHHREADDAWREFLRGLSVGADRRGAHLGWQTQF
jgi:hypothetical protein